MAWADDDITGVINGLLPSIFSQLVIPGDPLSLKTIRLWPLQDDPTRVAPYVVFGPHPEVGMQPRKDYSAEIGGPIMYWVTYRATFGTPRATTREAARSNIGNLANRLQRILQANYTLGGAQTPGGGEWLSGNDPLNLLLSCEQDIFGGDAEFYGIGRMLFRYSFERGRNW